MQIPAFVRTQTDTKLHVPEILYLTHYHADSFEVLVGLQLSLNLEKMLFKHSAMIRGCKMMKIRKYLRRIFGTKPLCYEDAYFEIT